MLHDRGYRKHLDWRLAEGLDVVNSAIVCALDASSTAKLYVGELDPSRDVDAKRLPPAELIAASRVPAGLARSRYVSSRLFVREVIAHELGVQHFDEPFLVGRFGKPYLASSSGGVRFNISHTGTWIVCAISRCGDVGVDIERAGRTIPTFALDRIFRNCELRQIDDLSDRSTAQLIAWTRKEAALKCLGLGLSIDPRMVEIPMPRDREPALMWFKATGVKSRDLLQLSTIAFQNLFIGTVAELLPKAA